MPLSFFICRKKLNENVKRFKMTVKRPEIYKPFGFLIVILSLFKLSGFTVLVNYFIIMVEVKHFI